MTEQDDDDAPPRRKFDNKILRCHNCRLLSHFKSDCREPPKKKALLAEERDDGPMILMLEVCKRMDNEKLDPPALDTVIVMLVEEKVYLHDRRRMQTAHNVWYFNIVASNHMTRDKA